ncbi:MAG: hypothetical protein LH473_05150 [Chitinophagales bacterium]|nr:hypothetical protein [Chitinophagales bacterium]
MKQTIKSKEFVVQKERTNFKSLLVKNPNYFGNIPGSKFKPNYKLVSDVTYEQITCVGYNPDTVNMEAVFSVKQSTGYSGNLCTAGSFEHVRFYLDFHDGLGYIDQGSVAMNVHDIPAKNDCNGNSIFPIKYVATLKKVTSKSSKCESPLLPTLRAILSWNSDPPAASPNWKPVWGSVMDCDVQLKPFSKFVFPHDFDLSEYFKVAALQPKLSAKQVADITGLDMVALNPQPLPPKFSEVAKLYEKLKVPASRFAFKTVHNMIKYPSSEITLMNQSILKDLKVNLDSIIDLVTKPLPVDTSKANVDYEELECLGLDYNSESLVATIKIKKNAGYSSDLCGAGSNEYISFWIDWNDECSWQYLNTVTLNAHDITMKGDHLCYSVALPLDATFHRKLCASPNVVRVRSVLSWNVAPSTTDPNKLEFYGNRVDAHVQIKPGIEIITGDVMALYNIIGGIDVDHVDNITGLTKLNSVFAYNALPVSSGAAFGGEIVINGPLFPGFRYRIKVTNLSDSTFYYLTNALATVGWSPVPPVAPWTTQSPDPIDHYYNYLQFYQNTLSVLGRFTPGTNDLLLVELEIEGLAGSFGKVIQMDNVWPVVKLQIDDNGDCTKYSKGETITGKYYVNDLNLRQFEFSSTYGGLTIGNSNTPPLPGTVFSIPTTAASYPCGNFSLHAVDKTIVDSQIEGHHSYDSYNVCLK